MTVPVLMVSNESLTSLNWSEDRALRAILEGTAVEMGGQFFAALVKNLVLATGWHDSWVSEYLPEHDLLRTLAFWSNGEILPDVEYPLAGTPCEIAVRERTLVHYSDNVAALFPQDTPLEAFGAKGYLGVPLTDENDEVIGHLAMINNAPSPKEPRGIALFNIFAARATAELKRIRAEAARRDSDEQLSAVFNCALDAIVTVDSELCIVLCNDAAQRIFDSSESRLIGTSLQTYFSEDGADRLRTLMRALSSGQHQESYLWVPGEITARAAGGRTFRAEATLSRCELQGADCFTVILHDINARLEAEAQIKELTDRAQYLEEELRALYPPDEIIGKSPVLIRALDDVRQVSGTDATVLVLGETGTGKELFARAIHQSSMRSDKPLVKVSCAALPTGLIESELFGHEKGAFTGAISRRIGRFTLADGGTIFLDEVGELPLDLQAKLLRILQEGEFEPLGSSESLKVDVRVIAATNRDLAHAVASGEFREDLYYRLNVFPLNVPPLRERNGDIPTLAHSFLDRFARGIGRPMSPLTESDCRLLSGYPWPGNVRELENVIERAVITAVGGRVNLTRALPESISGDVANPVRVPPGDFDAGPIRTQAEIQTLERGNILRALEETNWRIAGAGGAAERLDMKPSTLSSRIKALGLHRP